MSPRQKTTQEFIEDAKRVHGDTYDYSKSVYAGAQKKIEIYCPQHGSFSQSATSHLGGGGCPACWEERRGIARRQNSIDDFLEKARSKHGDKYDYSQVKLEMLTKEVDIICPKHGVFQQKASYHLKGHGCRKCGADKQGKGLVEEMIGQTFGRLLVTSIDKSGQAPIAICKCSCGNSYKGRAYHIRDLKIRSCGCLNNELRVKRTLKDLTGKTFGYWTVLERAKTRTTAAGQKKALWKCKCACGKTADVMASALNSGGSTSCGCYRIELVKELFTENLIGEKFNRLLVTSRAEDKPSWGDNSRVRWNCKCDCGETVSSIAAHSLKSGGTKSCGCYMLDQVRKSNSKPLAVGHRSGLLTVVRELEKSEKSGLNKGYQRMNCYRCKCDCGNTKDLPSFLLRGDVAQVSCGCLLVAGGDSFKRFIEDSEYAASKCFLYIADTIFDDCIKDS